jgi:hypothetical protein
MRTTLTLDDELAAALKAKAARTRQPFKVVVNEMVRLGLLASEAPPSPRAYRLEPSSLGEPRPEYDLTKALGVAEQLEDAEVARKLDLRK